MASWQRNEGFRSKAKASTFKLGFRDHGLPVKVRAPPSLPLLFLGSGGMEFHVLLNPKTQSLLYKLLVPQDGGILRTHASHSSPAKSCECNVSHVSEGRNSNKIFGL